MPSKMKPQKLTIAKRDPKGIPVVLLVSNLGFAFFQYFCIDSQKLL